MKVYNIMFINNNTVAKMISVKKRCLKKIVAVEPVAIE
jgi:hypothetical protein